MHVILQAAPGPDLTLRLTYASGEVVTADLKPFIGRGGVLARLQDPDFFVQVVVGEDGRYVEWSGEIDLCADALWHTAHNKEGVEAA